MIPDHCSNADKYIANSDHLPQVRPNENNREPIRIMLIGSTIGINEVAKSLYHLGFAEINDWSKPQTHPNSDQQMSILTKWIKR